MITIAQILKEIRRQLDWRGPGVFSEGQGHVILTRDMATRLDEWAITLIKERDELVAYKEHMEWWKKTFMPITLECPECKRPAQPVAMQGHAIGCSMGRVKPISEEK